MDRGYEVEIFETLKGKKPFITWIEKLKDRQAVAVIKLRLRRIALGNLGVSKSVGGGVYELRINFGPGYRVYYGVISQKIVLLLCGGSKNTQDNDIKIARTYLNEFEERNK